MYTTRLPSPLFYKAISCPGRSSSFTGIAQLAAALLAQKALHSALKHLPWLLASSPLPRGTGSQSLHTQE